MNTFRDIFGADHGFSLFNKWCRIDKDGNISFFLVRTPFNCFNYTYFKVNNGKSNKVKGGQLPTRLPCSFRQPMQNSSPRVKGGQGLNFAFLTTLDTEETESSNTLAISLWLKPYR